MGQFLPNIKERLFCKRPHHPMLKKHNVLCALAQPALFLAAERCRALHNIEEEGGRIVSEVGGRYFCKHRYQRLAGRWCLERSFLPSTSSSPDGSRRVITALVEQEGRLDVEAQHLLGRGGSTSHLFRISGMCARRRTHLRKRRVPKWPLEPKWPFLSFLLLVM